MSTRCASGVSTVHLALSWNESLRLNANQAASTGSWSGDSDQLHMQVRSPKAADIRLDTEHAIKHERMSPTPDARPGLSGTEGSERSSVAELVGRADRPTWPDPWQALRRL